MRILQAVLLSTAFLAGGVAADEDITRECILTGHVHNSSQDKSGNKVRVTFHNAENGENAPCRMSKSNTRARIQFKASAKDRLQNLPDGAAVQYRYQQRRDGQDQWKLMAVSET